MSTFHYTREEVLNLYESTSVEDFYKRANISPLSKKVLLNAFKEFELITSDLIKEYSDKKNYSTVLRIIEGARNLRAIEAAIKLQKDKCIYFKVQATFKIKDRKLHKAIDFGRGNGNYSRFLAARRSLQKKRRVDSFTHSFNGYCNAEKKGNKYVVECSTSATIGVSNIKNLAKCIEDIENSFKGAGFRNIKIDVDTHRGN